MKKEKMSELSSVCVAEYVATLVATTLANTLIADDDGVVDGKVGGGDRVGRNKFGSCCC